MNKLNSLLITILIIVAAAGWMRPTGLPTVTDYYFTDQDGKVVIYDRPSWVDGEVTDQSYEGKGIYAIHYDSGWTVRVNRNGVVWRADFVEPLPSPSPSVPTDALIIVAYVLGAILISVSVFVAVRKFIDGRKSTKALTDFLETKARQMYQSDLRSAVNANAGGAVNMTQDESGVWKEDNS